jgi:hypothetical protein
MPFGSDDEERELKPRFGRAAQDPEACLGRRRNRLDFSGILDLLIAYGWPRVCLPNLASTSSTSDKGWLAEIPVNIESQNSRALAQ